jgi:hypothetical protein
MSNITDLERYRNKAYLELCLTLVEDAFQECERGNNDMVKELLSDILETFDLREKNIGGIRCEGSILGFPVITK